MPEQFPQGGKVTEKPAVSEEGLDLQFQEKEPFDDFAENIDQNAERRSPTEQEERRMDSNLIQLSEVFAGSDIKWQLDGAMNISILKGAYIGIHKDVDISVEESELEAIDAQLLSRGYGLFLSYPKYPHEPNGTKIMERVDAGAFADADSADLVIASVDEQGSVREDRSLNYIDVHIVRRNDSGKPVSRRGVELPEKWFEPQPAMLQGQEINLSHSAKTAYFKLHSTRNYDQTDLQQLAETGSLTLNDISEIENVLHSEELALRKEVEVIVSRVLASIEPEMTAAEIFDAFAKEPRIAKSLDKIKEQLTVLSQKIEISDRSQDVVIGLVLETFNFSSNEQVQKNKMDELRKWVQDNMETQELDDALKS